MGIPATGWTRSFTGYGTPRNGPSAAVRAMRMGLGARLDVRERPHGGVARRQTVERRVDGSVGVAAPSRRRAASAVASRSS